MKTYKNLYNRIYAFENLYQAYKQAKKGKRYREDVLRFSENLENNLLDLQKELMNQTYMHGNYRQFIISDAKKRLIKAAPFRDRLVHHAICNVIEPIFDKSFIYHSYACRKGKGTHKAINTLQNKLKNMGNVYCLQCDISKYFASIDHNVLLSLLSKKVADKKVMNLLKIIIESDYDIINYKGNKAGIPIGNLTSQLFANIYLDRLDQFIKHDLKEKHYIRYMDDFLIVHKSKDHLHLVKENIKNFVEDVLYLLLHPKKAIVFPVANDGVNFLGFRVFDTHKLLRKSTVKRFIQRFKVLSEEQFEKGIVSWCSYAKSGNSFNLRRSISLQYVIGGLY